VDGAEQPPNRVLARLPLSQYSRIVSKKIPINCSEAAVSSGASGGVDGRLAAYRPRMFLALLTKIRGGMRATT